LTSIGVIINRMLGRDKRARRTMAGFLWSPSTVTPEMRGLPGDLWCVRDAFCMLFGWSPGSDDWNAFVEGPLADDLYRLIDYFGLHWYDPEHEAHKAGLEANRDHPGISLYALHSVQITHCMFEPNIQHLRELPEQYRQFRPELFRLVIDVGQDPR
jgi:hypothetical protein